MSLNIEKISIIDNPKMINMFVSYEDINAQKTTRKMLEKSPLIGIIVKNDGNIGHGVFSPKEKSYLTSSRTMSNFIDADLNSVYKINRTISKIFTDLSKQDNIELNYANLEEMIAKTLEETKDSNVFIENNAIDLIADKSIISIGSLFNKEIKTEPSKVSLEGFKNFINRGLAFIEKGKQIEENMVSAFNEKEENDINFEQMKIESDNSVNFAQSM